MSQITEDQFNKFIKEIFSGVKTSKKRLFMCGPEFIQGYYDQFGKDKLRELVIHTEFATTKEGIALIEKLLNE